MELMMSRDTLQIDCEEWREVAKEYPMEMEIVMAMMADADDDVCQEEAA
jgi:hypothetical protein